MWTVTFALLLMLSVATTYRLSDNDNDNAIETSNVDALKNAVRKELHEAYQLRDHEHAMKAAALLNARREEKPAPAPYSNQDKMSKLCTAISYGGVATCTDPPVSCWFWC